MNLWKCILKTFLIMSLMVIFFIFSGCSDPDPRKGLTADSVNVAMSLSNKGLVLFSQDNKPVFLGTFSGVSSPRAVVIRNLTRHQNSLLAFPLSLYRIRGDSGRNCTGRRSQSHIHR